MNDIALLTLSEPVDASFTPANLPLAHQVPQGGSAVTFVGWGVTVTRDSSPDKLPSSPTLRRLEMNALKPEICDAYEGRVFNAMTQMCTTSLDGKILARPGSGDSGSAALGGYCVTLVGIVSKHQDEFGSVAYQTLSHSCRGSIGSNCRLQSDRVCGL